MRLSRTKVLSVFLIGLFIGAGFIPGISGITKNSDDLNPLGLTENISYEYSKNDYDIEHFKILNAPSKHKISAKPPWNGYDIEVYDKIIQGVASCWHKNTEISGNSLKTTLCSKADVPGGNVEYSMLLLHFDGFIPPKTTEYLFKFTLHQEGRARLYSLEVLDMMSMACSSVDFCYYLWDGESINFQFFDSDVFFKDSTGGNRNGYQNYDITKTYTIPDSTFLIGGKYYTFGFTSKTLVHCTSFLIPTGEADNQVNNAKLQKIEIEWENSPPNTPSLSSPSNGASDISTSPTLSWDCNDPDGNYESLEYNVYLGTSSSPSLLKSGITGTSYSASDLKRNTKYYWKIKAIDSKGESKTSPVWSFKTRLGCCFPEGTQITMADGSFKNIENVSLGDTILSYDIETDKYGSWMVKMLGSPVHPVYTINDGLLSITVDHPLFIKKPDGTVGIGAIDASLARDVVILDEYDDILDIEIGDYLFCQDNKWVEITSINSNEKLVQTYNIMSFSGMRTYFADGILVYEEIDPDDVRPNLEIILERFPRFTKLIFSSPLILTLIKILGSNLNDLV